jgi:hypothetical protein
MQGDAGLIAVKLPAELAPPAAASRLGVHLPAQHCHLFDAAGSAFLHPVTNKH